MSATWRRLPGGRAWGVVVTTSDADRVGAGDVVSVAARSGRVREVTLGRLVRVIDRQAASQWSAGRVSELWAVTPAE